MWPFLDFQSAIGHLLKVCLPDYVLDHLDSHRCHYSSQLEAGLERRRKQLDRPAPPTRAAQLEGMKWW